MEETSCSRRHREELMRITREARGEFVPERDNKDVHLRANITLVELLEKSDFGRRDATSEFSISKGEEWFEEMACGGAYPLDGYAAAMTAGANRLLGPYGDIGTGKSVGDREIKVYLIFKRIVGTEDKYPWFL